MQAAVKVWTDEELMALPRDGIKRELLHGEIVMSPTGSEHGCICTTICGELHAFTRRRKLGLVFDSSTGFRLTPEDVLSPDVSFVAKERLAGNKRPPRGFFHGSPDLVVEVLSPSDSVDRVHEKMALYFAHGCRLGWVINPAEKTALVYHGASADRLLRLDEVWDGEDVVPGFQLPLTELFSELSF